MANAGKRDTAGKGGAREYRTAIVAAIKVAAQPTRDTSMSFTVVAH